MSHSEIVKEAVKHNAITGYTVLMEQTLNNYDFRNTDLIDPLFESSDLQGANFSGMNLGKATFNKAKLIGANLSGCDLTKVKFGHADLFGANLDNAKVSNDTGFCYTKGNGKQVKSFFITDYHVTYTFDRIFIGNIGIAIEVFKNSALDSVMAELLSMLNKVGSNNFKAQVQSNIEYVTELNNFAKANKDFIVKIIELYPASDFIKQA